MASNLSTSNMRPSFSATAAVSSAIEALRKTQADKDDPRGFLVVLGASGSGNSPWPEPEFFLSLPNPA